MSYNEDLIRIIDSRIASAQRKVVDFGTVQSRDTTGPGATVVFDGTVDGQPVKVPGHVHCFGGDRVVMEQVKGNWVVLGTFNRRQLAESYTRAFGPGTPGTSTSASFVDQPCALVTTLTKRYDLTALRLSLISELYVTVAPTVVATAVRVAGLTGTETASIFTPIDFNIGVLNFNAAGTHLAIPGFIRGTNSPAGFPAGDYTITARWRRISGTGTMTQDSNDLNAVEVDEIFRTSEV